MNSIAMPARSLPLTIHSKTHPSHPSPPDNHSQPNIAPLPPNPLLPRHKIRLLEIPHPPPSIKKRRLPPPLPNRPAQLHQLPLAPPMRVPSTIIHQIVPQLYSFRLVIFFAPRNQLLSRLSPGVRFRHRGGKDRCGHTAAHLVVVPGQCEERGPAPEDISRGGVRIALGRVEEEVADAGAGDVLVLGGNVCEGDARGYFLASPVEGGGFEVRFAEVGEAEEPEDGFGDAGEDAEPGSEGCGFDLEGHVRA
jgi:hypothetical protein